MHGQMSYKEKAVIIGIVNQEMGHHGI